MSDADWFAIFEQLHRHQRCIDVFRDDKAGGKIVIAAKKRTEAVCLNLSDR